MKILAITNLYPRPDRPVRGMYNKQLFDAMVRQGNEVRVVVPMASAFAWPAAGSALRCEWPEDRPQTSDLGSQFLGLSPQVSSLILEYLPVFHIPFIGRNMAAWFYERALSRKVNLFQECDVVYSSWLYPDGVAAGRMAATAEKPHWMMALGSDVLHLGNGCRRNRILEAVNRAAGVICVAQHLADALVKAGVDRTKLHVVPNGVDAGVFRFRTKDEARKQLSVSGRIEDLSRGYKAVTKGLLGTIAGQRFNVSSLPAEAKIVLFVGNFLPEKNPVLCLEAFSALLRNAACKILLVFIGDGPMKRRVEELADSMGISGSVIFSGGMTHGEVALWMNVADCLCLTSKSEGMPNAVLEAMASGLPMVSTPVGGVPGMVTGEPMAVIAGNAGEIANGLTRLINMHEADRIAMSNRHCIRTWDVMAKDVTGLMESRRNE